MSGTVGDPVGLPTCPSHGHPAILRLPPTNHPELQCPECRQAVIVLP